MGSCYLAAGYTCSQYDGSVYASSVSTMGQQCTQAGGTFSMGPCPTSNQLPGQCVLYCGQANENVVVLYAGSPTDTQSFCVAQRGTYLP
jgi:hypothetical protein